MKPLDVAAAGIFTIASHFSCQPVSHGSTVLTIGVLKIQHYPESEAEFLSAITLWSSWA